MANPLEELYDRLVSLGDMENAVKVFKEFQNKDHIDHLGRRRRGRDLTSDLINYAMWWGKSRDGHEYWRQVRDKYRGKGD